MSRSVAEIIADALQLPQNDQFKLARTLLEHANPHPEPAVDRAWEEEIEHRIAAIDSGVARGRPFVEVLADVDQNLS
jgi:hypothetical protein